MKETRPTLQEIAWVCRSHRDAYFPQAYILSIAVWAECRPEDVPIVRYFAHAFYVRVPYCRHEPNLLLRYPILPFSLLILPILCWSTMCPRHSQLYWQSAIMPVGVGTHNHLAHGTSKHNRKSVMLQRCVITRIDNCACILFAFIGHTVTRTCSAILLGIALTETSLVSHCLSALQSWL